MSPVAYSFAPAMVALPMRAIAVFSGFSTLSDPPTETPSVLVEAATATLISITLPAFVALTRMLPPFAVIFASSPMAASTLSRPSRSPPTDARRRPCRPSRRGRRR